MLNAPPQPLPTHFRRHPLWGTLAAVIGTSLVLLTWQAAAVLAPVMRGFFLALVFWCLTLTLWEFAVPIVTLHAGELVFRPLLGIGTQRRRLEALRHVGVTETKLRLDFEHAEPIAIPLRRVAPNARQALIDALQAAAAKRGATGRTSRREVAPPRRKRH